LPAEGYQFELSLTSAQLKRLKAEDTKKLKVFVTFREQGKMIRREYAVKTITAVKTPTAPLEPALPPSVPSTPPLIIEQGSVVQGGQIPVARYEFKALFEAWEVRKLTIVNDTQNDGFDYDRNEANPVLKRAIVRYKNKDGLTLEKSNFFGADRAIISDLAIFVPRNSSATVEIMVELLTPQEFGPHYSGRTFRVGIQDIGNNGTTFDAIGLVSSDRDTSFTSAQISGAQSIPTQIVRKAVPRFSAVQTENNLISGDNKAYSLTVKAEGASVELSRLVFDVNESGLTAVDQAKVWRGSSLLQPEVRWDAGATSCFANTAQAGAGTGMNCAGAPMTNSKLIVVFSEPEIISKDETLTYTLNLNVQGAGTGSSLAVKLATGDEGTAPALTSAVPTTGFLFTGGADGLFATDADYRTEATAITDRNIIWSDRSAESHNAASDDYTNGYLLRTTLLPTFVLSR
jgi:hypothetical protein